MRHQYLKNVATLKLHSDKCKGCGMCTQVCPHGVFTMANGKAIITDLNSCMECGACLKNCPFAAIEVKPGVGCAAAIIHSMIYGGEPTCDCGGGEKSSDKGGQSCC